LLVAHFSFKSGRQLSLDLFLGRKMSCPVKHDEASSSSSSVESAVKRSGCPVDHGKASEEKKKQQGQQYNVYAQPIDTTNQMPLNPQQLPAVGQREVLSTERVLSHIPKGGTDGNTWEYPSPQMFFNALKRKGKGEDVSESDMETIVAVHNNMNEKAWSIVQQWERTLHKEDFEKANGVRLSRFMGRPNDLSPMAWFKSTFLGYPTPFDRHDWIVERNGEDVRYVIDYYYDERKSKLDEKPGLHDIKSVQSITMDARPAIDSFQSILDRIKFPIMEKFDMVEPLSFVAVEPKTLSKTESETEGMTCFESLNSEKLRGISSQIAEKCQTSFKKVETCSSEDECSKASVALTFCMASLVCPPEANRYKEDVKSETRFDEMVDCMGRFEKAAMEIRQQQKNGEQ